MLLAKDSFASIVFVNLEVRGLERGQCSLVNRLQQIQLLVTKVEDSNCPSTSTGWQSVESLALVDNCQECLLATEEYK